MITISLVEDSQTVADTRTAAPIRSQLRNPGYGRINVADIELNCCAGKFGRKKENFSPAIDAVERMNELQDHAGINIH